MVREVLLKVRSGSHQLRLSPAAVRSEMLTTLATAVKAHIPLLLEENQRDCLEHAATLEPALAQRLKLTEDKIKTLVAGLQDLARTHDPLGAVLAQS